jgi:hypothetical protein|tara:strand:+ start:146 stop:292 length:147 start_codon:yes stop_codon:yes gene_type:complete
VVLVQEILRRKKILELSRERERDKKRGEKKDKGHKGQIWRTDLPFYPF